MATRTASRRARKTPRHPRGPSARTISPAAATRNGDRRPSTNGVARGKAAFETRYAESRERPDLYPFTISGIPI